MALPEIPDSWFKFAQLLVTLGLAVLGAIGYTSLRMGQERHGEQITAVHEVQAVNGAKIDAAKVAADTAKDAAVTSVAQTDAKLDDIKRTVTSLPPAVASEVQKSKGK